MSSDLKKHPAVRVVADGTSELSAALHTVLQAQNDGENLLFSPLSLSTVVAMTYLGARGSTASEIMSVFNFPENPEVLCEGYSKVLGAFQESTGGYTLAAANRLYCMSGYDLNQQYLDRLQKTFGAEVEQVNFSNNADAAAEINHWVENITNAKIKDLISKDSLDSSTALVLVNGLYFKGQWKDKFNKKHTRKETFHVNENKTVQVDMMFKQAKFPYASLYEMDAQAVALPYEGNRLCMVIYVPREIDGLGKIEEALKILAPSQILDTLISWSILHVFLPRFKVEHKVSLVKPLEALGAKSMFESDIADFSGIPESGNNEGLFVSDIVQKAFIEVNEDGSEAAAATALRIGFLSSGPPPRPREFRVDRPFYFQIVDRHTDVVLFAGAIKNPTQD